MSRNKTLVLSEEEKESLDEARMQIYGTDSVPYGEVIQYLCDEVTEDD